MALDAKFNAFKVKHDLGDEAMAEMLSIFNDSFIELAHKLLSSNDIQVPKTTPKPTKSTSDEKKFATKIAAEYAAENDLTIEDFDKQKITKKDIDEYIKTNKSGKSNKTIPKLDTTPVVKKEKKEPVSKERCCGLTKTGAPCNRPGTEKPEGSSKCFCFRHAMDWKMYEISSDSDLEEEEPHSEEIFRDLAVTTEE